MMHTAVHWSDIHPWALPLSTPPHPRRVLLQLCMISCLVFALLNPISVTAVEAAHGSTKETPPTNCGSLPSAFGFDGIYQCNETSVRIKFSIYYDYTIKMMRIDEFRGCEAITHILDVKMNQITVILPMPYDRVHCERSTWAGWILPPQPPDCQYLRDEWLNGDPCSVYAFHDGFRDTYANAWLKNGTEIKRYAKRTAYVDVTRWVERFDSIDTIVRQLNRCDQMADGGKSGSLPMKHPSDLRRKINSPILDLLFEGAGG